MEKGDQSEAKPQAIVVTKQEASSTQKLKSLFGNFLQDLGKFIQEEEIKEMDEKMLQQAFATVTDLFQNLQPKAFNANRPDPPQLGYGPDPLQQETTITDSTTIDLDLRYLFEENMQSIEEALDKVNFAAASLGFKFKKGPQSKMKNGIYYSLYCKQKLRTSIQKEGSISHTLAKKPQECLSYYRFFSENPKEGLKLVTSHTIHNHSPQTDDNLPDEALEDIKYFTKRRKITDIVKFLEKKYKKTFNYWKVRYLFRKANPLFGPQDCSRFVLFLQRQSAFIKHVSDDKEKSLTKLFFATALMKKSYELYKDVVLIDATYKTNQYQIPLLVFSGINVEGRCVLFGFALINDETAPTYEWAIKAFLEAHDGKKPGLFVYYFLESLKYS